MTKASTPRTRKPNSKPSAKASRAGSATAIVAASPARPELRIVGGRGSHKLKPGAPPSGEQLRLARARADFLDQLRSGSTIRGAARRASIAYSTVCDWRKAEPDFDAEVQSAILDGNASIEDRVLKASINDWRAGVRLLEVRDPERWAPKPPGADVNVNLSLANLSEAEVARRIAELEERLLANRAPPIALPGLTIEGPITTGEKVGGENI